MINGHVLQYFEEITKIPRPSGYEAKMREYLLSFAKSHGLLTKTDAAGNVCIRKPAAAGFEDAAVVVLQAHMDMVCEKDPEKAVNFQTDPIETITKGDWIHACGTTLGADNGVGIALALDVLTAKLPTGPIECVFTVEEETGLTGAEAIGPDFFTGKMLINLDSEEEGSICTGCAGGVETFAQVSWEPYPAPMDDVYYRIDIDGIMDFSYVQSEGDASKLEVTLDDNLHQYLDVQTTDRKLTIRFNKKVRVTQLTKFVVKANSKWLKDLRVSGNANFMAQTPLSGDELKVKGLDNSLIQFLKPVEMGVLQLSVNNSANIVAENIKIDRLECNMDGSGSIRLKNGTANQANYTIVSSGDIHAFGVQVKSANCKVAGSGTMEVYPLDAMKANLVGKGNIRYKGNVNVEQRIIGKGKIEKAE